MCAICMCGIGVMVVLVVPSVANVFACSFPWMHDFLYCISVWEPCNEVYYGGDEDFVWVVMLEGWLSYVVV